MLIDNRHYEKIMSRTKDTWRAYSSINKYEYDLQESIYNGKLNEYILLTNK